MSQSKLSFPDYFSAFAANYTKQTGNSTRQMFADSYDEISAIKPFEQTSVIHDNAAGPGTAASVITDRLPHDSVPSILVTDNVPRMVDAAKATFESWPQVETKVLDSLDLADIPDEHFTHSILNFSIFTFSDPLKGLQEIHRTLKTDGLAVLPTWKRFGAGKTIHGAQALVRPDLPRMWIPRPEFFEEGVLEKLAIEAGFEADKIQVLQKTVIVKGEELHEGLKVFMQGDMMKPARQGWTDEEEARWPAAVEEAIQGEVDAFGGVKFEAWLVLAKK
ncbi:S-adenosyl-L-methionine-dependent methyltransferase [Plectosphaerella plurivora]|uniref:S-adenosyl-L-methionine-dependent methyltransferase n=1 Tax=Plectosphaerella plurivora TaxID=936078 RepID=A0A9P8V6K1_9PEZI|nr:S-adenosyl-L-methionine-dependent methyltransferase [Plectosphaerella plurivora]